MTRDRIKDKIEDIIYDHIWTNGYGDGIMRGIDGAAEEIMKLWDQGFTYELDKPKNS